MQQCVTLLAAFDCRHKVPATKLPEIGPSRTHGIQRIEQPMDVQNIEEVPAFTTKDGSEIRELLANRNSAIRNQSLAEARLGPGITTTSHHHPQPGEQYELPSNAGHDALKFLCCCAPGYEHDDTVFIEEE